MTDNRTTELLPCPFCGGEADEYEGDYGNGIYCMMCGAMVGEPIHLEYMTTKRVSIDEAIAAWNIRATYGTLTAEQVREAIFHGSVYASYDGAQYYANGINMQAIADELNARAERTCECIAEYTESPFDGKTIVLHRCSECHELMRPHMRYCPNCGAKVVNG